MRFYVSSFRRVHKWFVMPASLAGVTRRLLMYWTEIVIREMQSASRFMIVQFFEKALVNLVKRRIAMGGL